MDPESPLLVVFMIACIVYIIYVKMRKKQPYDNYRIGVAAVLLLYLLYFTCYWRSNEPSWGGRCGPVIPMESNPEYM